jgi:hypothetical protein
MYNPAHHYLSQAGKLENVTTTDQSDFWLLGDFFFA